MAYRRDDIERVRVATDLVELVAEVTKVKRSGRSVMAVCPFHQEKTPSMSIDPARGLYHCFGCGKSGDLFRFIQETQGLDFSDSVELLARRSGITLHRDPEAAKRRSRREALVGAVEKTVEFYHRRLLKEPDAAAARGYLRGRGYDADVVGTFRLGYSPVGGDDLVRMLRDDKVGEEVMVTAGLAVRSRTGRMFDRFRGRVMFPIFDLRGDAVGFGARLLEGEGPKYLNSPETPIYHKSLLLYGLNWSKSKIVREGTAIVVEGYTDVIALDRAGLGIAVATCGTALGESHLDLLRRFTEKVVLMFDADEAGVGASLRGFERSVPGDLDLRVATLPPGRDPADLVDQGDTGTITEAAAASVPLLRFRIERELERFDLREAEARGRAVRAVAALIARHPDSVTRHEYAVDLSRRTGVDLEVVGSAVEAAAREARRKRSAGDEPPPRPGPAARLTGQEKAEQELLRLMLANPPGLGRDDLDESLFTRPEYLAAFQLLAPALAALDPGQPPDLGSLVGREESDLGSMLAELAMIEEPPIPEDPGELIRRIGVGAIDKRIEVVRREAEAFERDGEPEASSERLQELIALHQRREELWGPR